MAQVLQEKQGIARDISFRDPALINGGVRSSSVVDIIGDMSSSDSYNSRGNSTNERDRRVDPVIDDYGSRQGGYGSSSNGSDPNNPVNPINPDEQVENGTGYVDKTPNPSPSPVTDGFWTPDPNSSPEDNLSSLSSWLYSLFNSTFSVDGSLMSGATFGWILESSLRSIQRFANAVDYDETAKGALAEKVADYAASFIQAQFSAALSYQSWYLQQEYNSPVNQMNRLAEAGLSSAFIFGGLSSGNAQSAASMPSLNSPQSSGAAAIQQQENAAEKSLFGQIFGTAIQGIGSLVSAGASAVVSLAQAKSIKAMRPYEIALAGQKVVNEAATYEVLKYNGMQMKQNILLNQFDSNFKFEQGLQGQYKTSLDTAQTNYQSLWNNYTSEEQTTEWETSVIDKSGNRKTYRLTADQVQNALKNGGKISDTEYIEGSNSWGVNAQVNFDTEGKFIFPLASAKVKRGLSIGGHYDKSSKEGNNHLNEQLNEQSTSSSNGITDYSEDGTMFKIGNSKFTSVTKRFRVPLPEHKKFIENSLKKYQQALDEYNTYSSGAKARLLHYLDELHQNMGSFNSSALEALYRERVKSTFAPVSLQGD